MTIDVKLSPAAQTYLEIVGDGLMDLETEDREEVLRDLEAHLNEIGDQDPVTALGDPEAFVREFRLTAGMDDPPGRVRRMLAAVSRSVERISSHPMAARFHRHRPELRTVWVWIRGWVALNALWWFGAYWAGAAITFGVPWSDSDALLGVVLVGLATAASVWVDSHRQNPRWGTTDRAFTVVAAALLVLAWLNPVWIDANDEGYILEQTMFSNIYAYDLDGNPVDVLLYDQDGQPLNVGVDGEIGFEGEVFYDWFGPVRYEADLYGRPITNLYPLDRVTEEWNGSTEEPEFESIPPPPVPIPEVRPTAAAVETPPSDSDATSPAD